MVGLWMILVVISNLNHLMATVLGAVCPEPGMPGEGFVGSAAERTSGMCGGALGQTWSLSPLNTLPSGFMQPPSPAVFQKYVEREKEEKKKLIL